MKKWKCLFLPLAALLFAGAWLAGYTALNRFYDTITDYDSITYPIGEDVPFGTDYISWTKADGYFAHVNGFQIVDAADIPFAADPGSGSAGQTPDRLVLVDLTLKNTGSNAEGIPLSELRLFGIDELLFVDQELLDQMNPVLEGNSGISLSKDTEYRLTLPYALYQDQFSRGTWKHMDKYELFLQLTAFPTHKIVKLS